MADENGKKNPYLYAAGDPVNRIDPKGTRSPNAVADALGPAGDLTTGTAHLFQGDAKALWGDVAGVVVGGLAGAACGTAVAASAPATAEPLTPVSRAVPPSRPCTAPRRRP
ncbi:hypothetical protein ACFYWX_20840 [Streptomyces sp. NPDC002888]|uniref:hypothetical protein n=1 Tax=Streptomyces sp. NPDC002888 TaxID=3364668 RepID=UPI0036889B9D